MKENDSFHPFTLAVGALLVAGAPLVAACPARVPCRLRRLPAKEQGRRYDVETLEVMKRVLAPGSTAIDVGSFKGDILAMMVRLAPRGTHHAFEPIPRYAAMVRKRFPSPRIKVH